MFSADGATLAVTDQQTITLWDLRHHELLARPIRDAGGGGGIAINPESTLLLETRGDGSLLLRYLTSPGWRSQACRIANRNLTQTEWQQFLPGLPYQKTCPDLPPGH